MAGAAASIPGVVGMAERVTWWRPGVLAAALVVGALAVTPNLRPADGVREGCFGGDYLQEWIGGHLVRTGQSDRLYDREFVVALQHNEAVVGYAWDRDRYLPMVYPPFYYAAVSPLAALPMTTAAWAWAGLMLVVAAGAAWLVVRHVAGGPRSLAWLLPVAACFPPLLENATSGQKGGVVLLVFAATFVLLRRQRPTWAGLVFGLLAFKPQLGLVVGGVMLLRRDWRFVAGAATTVGLAALTSLTMGGELCEQYVAFVRQTADYLHTPGYDLAKAHCWFGFWHLLLGNGDPFVRPLTLACDALTLLLAARTMLAANTRDSRSAAFGDAFMTCSLATLLVSPHLMTYDLTLALLPMAWLMTGVSPAATIDAQPLDNRQRLRWAVALFVGLTVSTAIARATGLQLSVLVMFAATCALAGMPHVARIGARRRVAGYFGSR